MNISYQKRAFKFEKFPIYNNTHKTKTQRKFIHKSVTA